MTAVSHIGGAAPKNRPNAAYLRPTKSALTGIGRLSPGAVPLIITCALVAFSAFWNSRIAVGAVQMHLYLPVLVVGGVAAIGRLNLVPRPLVMLTAAFFTLFLLATAQDGGDIGATIKVGGSIFTVLAAALCLRREDDYRLAVATLALSVGVIATRGLLTVATIGEMNALKGVGNKNAFALYALPTLLVGAHLAMDRRAGLRLRIPTVIACALISATVISSLNRSGWLGVLIVGATLLRPGYRVRGIVIAIAIGVVGSYVLDRTGQRDAVEDRLEMTRGGGNGSDAIRRSLLEEAVQIGLENPLVGVSPRALTRSLASRLRLRMPAVEPHNSYGYLIGGTGFPSTLAFIGIFIFLCSAKRRSGTIDAPYLIRIHALQWAVQGMFTHEMLFAPGFVITLGLLTGLNMIQQSWSAVIPSANSANANGEGAKPRAPRQATTARTGDRDHE